MVSRRQFGLWTTSALLLGPSVARAGDDATAEATPQGLDALDFAIAVKTGETGPLAFELKVTNRSAKGQTVQVDIAEIELSGAQAPSGAVAWMNDHNPFSRRYQPPAFVDLPASTQTLCGVINTGTPIEDLRGKGISVSLVLQVGDGEGGSRQVKLPAYALDGQAADS